MTKRRLSFFVLIAFLLVACSGGNSGQPNANATPTVPPVNGFGIAENHVHSMVILPDAHQTMVLATHYGIFRSLDHGVTWQQTAAGPNQLMQDLMTYSLSSNPLDPQRLYVLTQPVTVPHKGTLGLYTSGDGGKTWQLSIPTASITSSSIYFAQAGNERSSEVYIYLTQLGTHGLRVSMDNGRHFSQAGSPLPFGELLGLLVMKDEPGHLIAYGNNGIVTTTDGGKHWQVVQNIQDSMYEMTTPGANEPSKSRGGGGN